MVPMVLSGSSVSWALASASTLLTHAWCDAPWLQAMYAVLREALAANCKAPRSKPCGYSYSCATDDGSNACPDTLASLALEWNDLDILERLGEGGFGVVYRAINRGTNEELAVKMSRHQLSYASGQGPWPADVPVSNEMRCLLAALQTLLGTALACWCAPPPRLQLLPPLSLCSN